MVICQIGEHNATRQWSNYLSTKDALLALCKLYEHRVQQVIRGRVEYHITDLLSFVDSLPELFIHEYDEKTNTYIPLDKDWIKTNIYSVIKEQV